ncbi:MAG: flagellar basal-body rod protein FlgF [Gammaproteobacteria bacterium]|nr:MAG: flagellar basal-body rod protein FlgF [Gammaproteobacteria bacterium]
MDRMIYVAMSGAQQTMRALQTTSNNLANVNTTGFRADLDHFQSLPVSGGASVSRTYVTAESSGPDFRHGGLITTGRDLDVAVDGDGFFAVLSPTGREAYTRAGDLHVDTNGFLVNGSGYQMLGNGGPMALPPFEKIEIASDGTISVRPVGATAEELVVIDRLKLVRPDLAQLTKGEDGLFSLGGQDSSADASVHVVSGAVEGSNVNAVEALVKMVSLSRQFEAQVKMMRAADDNAEHAQQLLSNS